MKIENELVLDIYDFLSSFKIIYLLFKAKYHKKELSVLSL